MAASTAPERASASGIAGVRTPSVARPLPQAAEEAECTF